MLKLDFSPILLLDEDGYLDPDDLLVFKCQNSPETIPDKLIINSLSMQTFLKNSIPIQEDTFGHSSFIATQLIIFLPVGHVDGNIRVSDQICI